MALVFFSRSRAEISSLSHFLAEIKARKEGKERREKKGEVDCEYWEALKHKEGCKE